MWDDLNKKDREKEIIAWDKEKRARDKCREKYKLVEQIPKSEAQEYNFLVRDMFTKYGEKKPPAMPCTYTSDEDSADGHACASTIVRVMPHVRRQKLSSHRKSATRAKSSESIWRTSSL